MTDTVIREAKLFEAGDYPDRGIEITEEDLDRIAGGTSCAPVRIEHAPSPFDGAIGVLKSVYRRGRELFGQLEFTRAAWELIRQAGARRLSVAIARDKSSIAEVSLVRTPRIPDAAVFSAGAALQLAETDIDLEAGFSEQQSTESVPAVEDSECDRLRRELTRHRAERTVDKLMRAGKLTPGSATFALALLEADLSNTVTFADAPVPVAELFRRFIEAQPKVIEFAELAGADAVPEEPGIFEKLGVTSARVEKHRGR